MGKPLVVVIAGPTATGKTKLSVELALRLRGEIISADSMQIYRRMDIGTTKPTAQERRGVPHHMIDVVEPTEEFTLKQYLDAANACIAQVMRRGNLPIVVGGTGLYLTSLVQNRQLAEEEYDPEYRALLEREYAEQGGEAMLRKLFECDPETARRLFPNDRKRILRALEAFHKTGLPKGERDRQSLSVESPYRFLRFALTADDRAFLYRRIDDRVEQMMRDGLEKEVRDLDLATCSRTARQAIGYRQFLPYFAGECSLDDVVASIQKESRNYAKRQLTWFHREKETEWFSIDRAEFNIIMNSCAERIAKQQEICYNSL